MREKARVSGKETSLRIDVSLLLECVLEIGTEVRHLDALYEGLGPSTAHTAPGVTSNFCVLWRSLADHKSTASHGRHRH